MTRELTSFIRSQAVALSLADLDQLITDLPALRDRSANIPIQTYPYLSDQLEFLCLFLEEEVVALNADLDADPLAEVAFVLLYDQWSTDLIPDAIHGMGLLDDAIIVSIVLRRHERVFRSSSHAYKLT
jgi:uncharacterized protein DUF1232